MHSAGSVASDAKLIARVSMHPAILRLQPIFTVAKLSKLYASTSAQAKISRMQLPLFVLASSLKFAAVESVQPVLANRQPSSVVAPESKLSVPSTTVQPYTAYSHGARSDSIVAIEK